MDQDDESPLPLDLPGPDGSMVYVRPHDLHVTKQPGQKPAWSARIVRLTHLGGLVRLDLLLNQGTPVTVQMSRDECAQLGLAQGDEVFTALKDLKYLTPAPGFVEDYVI
ncbi:MAG: TOBE-like domain-containing protein [Isosphaeraceae bacterium]|nr:TOBE-like domain-containing protein [Isosphaeraceae bacterium]